VLGIERRFVCPDVIGCVAIAIAVQGPRPPIEIVRGRADGRASVNGWRILPQAIVSVGRIDKQRSAFYIIAAVCLPFRPPVVNPSPGLIPYPEQADFCQNGKDEQNLMRPTDDILADPDLQDAKCRDQSEGDTPPGRLRSACAWTAQRLPVETSQDKHGCIQPCDGQDRV